MIDSEVGEDLSTLDLKEILQHQDLVLEEILAIKDIHSKIKLNMKTFVDHCRRKPEFTERLISLGLKCPMHQSNNPQMKKYTYIAVDVLTCDHETLADLFILPTKKSSASHEELLNDDEIEEEIETEEPPPDMAEQSQKYIFLGKILEYILVDELDENCLNYIAKALSTLVRKKISQFLQFFIPNPEYLQRLVSIAHYPSIAHLLAKMLTDDDDNLTDKAMEVKKTIIPYLLEKLHKDIDREQTLEVMEGIEDIINSSRYGDCEERSELQMMSDVMVSAKQVQFFVDAVLSSMESTHKTHRHFYTLVNATTYLTHLANRLNMDEHDFMFGNSQNPDFKPTLQYEINSLFLNFCRFVSCFDKIWDFREIAGKMFGFIPTKILQPLIVMTKHSKFGNYYAQIKKEERSSAMKSLLKMTCATSISGLLLQNAIALIEKMLLQEEQLASQSLDIICPDDLYLAIEKYSGAIATSIAMVLEESRLQRNKNENGIYFRKVLLLLDNYFKHPDVLKLYPTTAKLEQLFPSFNNHNCRLYAEKAIVLDHPGGSKVQKVEEFQFLYKNQHLIRSSSPELNKEEVPQAKLQKEEAIPEKTEKNITFKLDNKLKSLKERVKQKNTDKEPAKIQPPVKAEEQAPKATKMGEEPSQVVNVGEAPVLDQSPKKSNASSQEKGDQGKVESPSKSKQQTGLNFFVRHLMIY